MLTDLAILATEGDPKVVNRVHQGDARMIFIGPFVTNRIAAAIWWL